MTLLRRQPAGTPTGGQFTTGTRAEGDAVLATANPDGLDYLRDCLAGARVDATVDRLQSRDQKTEATVTTGGEQYTVSYDALNIHVAHPASGNPSRLRRAAWDEPFEAGDVPVALASVRRRVAALRTWERLAPSPRGDVTYQHVEVDDDPTWGRTATVWAKVNGTSYELRATSRTPGAPAEVTVADGGRELPSNKGLDVLELVGRAHGNHISPGWHAAGMLRSLHSAVTDHPEWA